MLKDIVVKSRTLDGYDAPYVPGWDCHGLPIEHQIEKTRGKEVKALEPRAFRQACREYAMSQVEAQREDFKRLGVMGDWDRPYMTMQPFYEAEQLRAFAQILRNGHVYKGLKPVHWCLGLPLGAGRSGSRVRGSRLRPRSTCASRVKDVADLAQRFGVRGTLSCAGQRRDLDDDAVDAARQPGCVALGPEFRYALIDTGTELLVLATELAPAVLTARRRRRARSGSPKSRARRSKACSSQHPFYERIGAGRCSAST